MVSTIVNLLFGCRHRRLTRPITPVPAIKAPRVNTLNQTTYVACLDCGKRFQYDAQKMRVGRPLD